MYSSGVAREKPKRKFIRERRRNACPACLDRNALNLVGQPIALGGSRRTAGCEVCGGKGWVVEVYPVGNEWRRYPWVIVG